MVSVMTRAILVQMATPDEMRGRVNAVDMIFIGASNELGHSNPASLPHGLGRSGRGAGRNRHSRCNGFMGLGFSGIAAGEPSQFGERLVTNLQSGNFSLSNRNSECPRRVILWGPP